MKTDHRMAITVAAALMLTIVSAEAKEQTSGKGRLDAHPIAGAGSTFIAPLVEKWIDNYQSLSPKVRISYDAVGSGEGVQRFVNGKVDFAASDGGMTDAQIAGVDRGVRFIPADIFAGKIKTWDDPRIKAANPAHDLPHEDIAVVVRHDSSGTTYAFTNHLSAISEAWRRGPGLGTAIEWPSTVMRARGNEGVAARIQMSEGSIGYVEYGFAQRLGLPMAVLQNKAGQFVSPDTRSIAKVFTDSLDQLPDDLRLTLPDPAGDGVYPIATYSWLILYGHYPEAATRTALQAFVKFGLTRGQEDSVRLGYVPLPEVVTARALAALDTLDPHQ